MLEDLLLTNIRLKFNRNLVSILNFVPFKKDIFILILLMFICLGNSVFTLGIFGMAFTSNKAQEIIVFISILISILSINIIFKRFKIYILVLILLLVSLVVESVVNYNKFMIYPHVFSKLLSVFILFASYSLSKKINHAFFKIITIIIVFFYFFDLFFLGWVRFYNPLAIFSVNPLFGAAGDSRVFHAQIVFLFIIPLLFFFTKYFLTKRVIYLFYTLIIFMILLIQNHRSIWISSLFCFLSATYFYKQLIPNRKITIKTLLIILSIIGVIVLIVLIADIGDTLTYRFDDVVNWQSQGTGLWRYKQTTSYLSKIANNIFWGLRFKGFETSLFGPTVGNFRRFTGHHFHSAYIDILFYHGLAGFFVVFGLIFHIIFQLYKIKEKTPEHIIAISFLIGIIPFSFTYEIPFHYWGIAGICYSMIPSFSPTKSIPMD